MVAAPVTQVPPQELPALIVPDPSAMKPPITPQVAGRDAVILAAGHLAKAVVITPMVTVAIIVTVAPVAAPRAVAAVAAIIMAVVRAVAVVEAVAQVITIQPQALPALIVPDPLAMKPPITPQVAGRSEVTPAVAHLVVGEMVAAVVEMAVMVVAMKVTLLVVETIIMTAAEAVLAVVAAQVVGAVLVVIQVVARAVAVIPLPMTLG